MDLATRFSPVFVFHEDENYFPINFEKVLPHITLENGKPVTETDVASGKPLVIPPNLWKGEKPASMSQVPVYSTVNMIDYNGDRYADIVYVVVYAYSNRSFLSHKKSGMFDTSGVVVRVNLDRMTPTQVYTSQSSVGGVWHTPPHMQWKADHPVVYVSHNTHNNYASPGRQVEAKVLTYDERSHLRDGIVWSPIVRYIDQHNPPLWATRRAPLNTANSSLNIIGKNMLNDHIDRYDPWDTLRTNLGGVAPVLRVLVLLLTLTLAMYTLMINKNSPLTLANTSIVFAGLYVTNKL
jgi:hypothetical protein